MPNQPPLILYHNDADGFCSAWIASHVYPGAELVPVQYGRRPPNVTGRTVMILDFSYPRDVLLDMAAKCDQKEGIVVLDHHKTAQEEIGDLDFCVFDMEKSGARLTWEFFWDNGLIRAWHNWKHGYSRSNPPWLVRYTEDRDLWRFQLDRSQAINAMIRSYPFDIVAWDDLDQQSPLRMSDLGDAILRNDERTIEQHIANAAEVEIAGHRVLCVNATTLFSEIAGRLAEGRPFGACYFDSGDGDGSRVFSLRSREGGVDVSEIAKQFGGGGHAKAAGFKLPSPELMPETFIICQD